MSIVLREQEQDLINTNDNEEAKRKVKMASNAQRFYDALQACKGPSLGTNFTLVCPYTMVTRTMSIIIYRYSWRTMMNWRTFIDAASIRDWCASLLAWSPQKISSKLSFPLSNNKEEEKSSKRGTESNSFFFFDSIRPGMAAVELLSDDVRQALAISNDSKNTVTLTDLLASWRRYKQSPQALCTLQTNNATY